MDREYLQQLVAHPSESLNVELKRWLDLDTPEGKCQLVRTCLALRNANGGHLLIGFDDATAKPHADGRPNDVEAAFHIDKVQKIVAEYSSQIFEVEVAFIDRDGSPHPVIGIHSGVRSPVVVKKDLVVEDKKKLARDDVLVRTLTSNQTVSTAKASGADWERLMEICFDNREADIGRFVRRHLGSSGGSIQDVFQAFAALGNPPPTNEERLKVILDDGRTRYENEVTSRRLTLPEHGAFEVALLMSTPDAGLKPNIDFLNLLASTNPNFTGWPMWLDSRQFEAGAQPHVVDGGWESLIADPSSLRYIEFQRKTPAGQFYSRRGLKDDLWDLEKKPALTVLDPSLAMFQVAEAIAVGLSFAKAMGVAPDGSLDFAFRWSRLKGRKLQAWADSYINSPSHWVAFQDECLSFTQLSPDTPQSAIAPAVRQAVAPLLLIFGGLELPDQHFDKQVRKLLNH